MAKKGMFVELKGLKETQTRIKRFVKAFAEESKEALIEASKEVYLEAQKLAPVDSGKLRDSLVIEDPKVTRAGQVQIRIGIDEGQVVDTDRKNPVNYAKAVMLGRPRTIAAKQNSALSFKASAPVTKVIKKKGQSPITVTKQIGTLIAAKKVTFNSASQKASGAWRFTGGKAVNVFLTKAFENKRVEAMKLFTLRMKEFIADIEKGL